MSNTVRKRVAFYAPMKSPNHPVPSGDREMARNLMRLIDRAGFDVDLVSELKIYDKAGNPERQRELRSAADAEAAGILERLPATDLWVTYHNYYKAPDLIGPRVAQQRGIPYVQIESTRATSRLNGPWAGFAQAAHEAADAARVIFYLTQNDLITLKREKAAGQDLVSFPPFLPFSELPKASTLAGPMLTVGMMRQGDKFASYLILAEALRHLKGDWHLNIAGDGPARSEVEQLLLPFGDRVTFLGQLSRPDLAKAYQEASVFLWPGVNEAFGMVYLEAQAHGIPVVAQDRPGLRDVLARGSYPAPEEGAEALANQIQTLLAVPTLRQKQGAEARQFIAASHLCQSAADRFKQAVTPLLEGAA